MSTTTTTTTTPNTSNNANNTRTTAHPGTAFLLHHPISVTTVQNSTHQGCVYSFDPVANYLVLQQPSSAFLFIRLSHIKNISIPNTQSEEFAALVAAGPIEVTALPIERLRIREEKRVREERERWIRRGKGVTLEAQSIFDAIVKTCWRFFPH